MTGRDPITDCCALVERRMIEAAVKGRRTLPLVAARGCDAHPADLALLIAGSVDLTRTLELARALMAVRWDRWQPTGLPRAPDLRWPEEAWMALRLSCLPEPLDQSLAIPADGTMVRRLLAGGGASAVDIALRRLRAAGVRPPLRGACADPETARRWAAALAFPMSKRWARAMAQRFEPPNQKEIR